MSTRLLNVALIGSSFMGRTHSNAYMKVAKFFDLPLEPVMHTIAARDEKKVAAFAKRWGWHHSTANWKEVCDNPEIDLIDISTPNHVHKEMALAALAAGKHLACEKPLAGNLDDAREMLKAAKKYKKSKTFVWFTYRRCPAVSFAQQLVAAGKLGKIYHVRAAYLQDWAGPDAPLVWRFRGDIAGSGSHGDLGAHIIDMARFITGDEIDEIAGAMEHTFIKERPIPTTTGGEISGKNAKTSKTKMGKSTVDDAVMFLARFKSGALASFEATRLSTGDKNRNRIEIHGEKGAIRFDFERMNELQWYDATIDGALQGWSTINVTSGADGHPYAAAWWPTAHVIGYEHGFINMASDIINVLGGKAPVVPLPDFEDAYQTQRVLQAAVESARNRCPIKMSQIK